MPAGFLPLLEGMQLEGELAARSRLDFDREQLEQWDSKDPNAALPGELEFELPVFEQCTVKADAPSIDVDALRGPYRLRYMSAGGKEAQRVLARGAEGYVPLSHVPRLVNRFCRSRRRALLAARWLRSAPDGTSVLAQPEGEGESNAVRARSPNRSLAVCGSGSSEPSAGSYKRPSSRGALRVCSTKRGSWRSTST